MGCGASSGSPKVADVERAKLGGDKSESTVLSLSETQLMEFRECFDAFDKDQGGSIDSDELGAPMRARVLTCGRTPLLLPRCSTFLATLT